ncbi:MAG TPA: family 78 glycoside hydrolase catalytic domain [Chitinophagaceae bacterium]|nr:family 78 glycoside hydrolase catalytic domain [Chitinophagaceae bacterium]
MQIIITYNAIQLPLKIRTTMAYSFSLSISKKQQRLFVSFLLALFFQYSHAQATSPLQVEQLRCEYTRNPLGIDTKTPHFSWTLTAKGRNRFQTAYEIAVSANEEDLNALNKNFWTTGKQLSAAQTHIPYNGPALKPFSRYWWRVRVYDEAGVASAWSAVNWFETAMLDASDWKASWISDGTTQPVTEADYYKDDPMPLFRKNFTAPKKIAAARLYISGLGYYEAYFNGKKAGDQLLGPGWTTYKKEVLYVVHDITPLLKKGTNAIGVMLGNGWWNPLPLKLFGRFDIRQHQQTGRPCVKAEVHIRYAEGTEEIIVTDETWKTAPGPVLRNNVYLGEQYDACKASPNWFIDDLENGKQAVAVSGPQGVLSVQMQPPIRVTKVIKPVSIFKLKKDTFLVNMGQNFAGVARIHVKGPAGTKITLRYGEGLFKDSSINLLTATAGQIKKGGIKGGPGAPETAWQEDSYILSGNGLETWSPRFTFHGFQYVEVSGWPGTPTLENIEGLRMNADLQQTGSFACSNPLFNQLHEAVQWTFLSNVFSVQSDCPGREKLGYGADMVVTADAFLYNYDMALFYKKAIQDFENEQQADGGITETAPYIGIADRGYGGGSGPLGWQLAFPFLQKKLYDYYGDTNSIATHYGGFKKQLAFLQAKAIDGLFHWDISDHESLDPRPEAFTAACFYYHHARLGAPFSGILNKKDDSLQYEALSRQIKEAIVKKYYVPNTGRFDNATQAAQTFALWYGLSPEREKTVAVLQSELARHNGHLSAGIFGVKMLFDVLRETNQANLAYEMATKKDFPGWGYMLANGASTLWESWAFPETVYSRNHPMFGSVDEWFYRSLLGINATAPGFKKIQIKPQPAGDLVWAQGSYQSLYGTIKSSWKKEGATFLLDVSVPVNTTAEVWIPAGANKNITESNVPVKPLRYENGYVVVAIGSGTYAFKVQN